MCTRIFDIGVWYPGEHFLALRQHLFRGGVEIGEDFDGHSGVAYER
jgi:hypothetical protein